MAQYTSPPAPESPRGDGEIRDLIARAQRGDREARSRLVEANLKLVRSIAGRFAASGRDPEDLFQLGCIGLLKAVDRFDLHYDVRFSTYAVPMILGEIRRHLRDDGPLRVSRSLKALAQQVYRVQDDLSKELGREPTVAELAARLGVPVEEIVAALEGSRPPASIQEPIHEGDGDPIFLGDQLTEGDVEPAWLDRVALREGIRRLPEREREVLLLRYFRDKTQVEVARLLGISQVQVSRLERRALAQVRRYLTGEA
ncbi:RNA polymerase sporulation sigma factor SigF [Caldinitratiruptor microaerophilus]|uniref:RNA polymerase sigma factor n=1 Tax=Caldinitratiruptor microaerophilus TaxID=671077 RepID=A0AA35CIV8_9FIRM|nr:RNA polymerase sporulation sigma factor SigF [Caldinitratiruptor microaerophilus]BDG59957.1 RNA polymerase sigma-F factor [Caldinitratiruptor microaerophilus]